MDLPKLENMKRLLDAFAPQSQEVTFLSSSIRFLHDRPRLQYMLLRGTSPLELVDQDRYQEVFP